MYEEERQAIIAEYIKKNSRASIDELCSKYDVSKSTIRRDLSVLEQKKLVRRTHGGALSLDLVSFEPSVSEKKNQYTFEKQMVAQKAAEFIKNGDTIIIDAGTTTELLSKQIKRFSKLTVVTNSLTVAYELQSAPGIEVIVIGGTLRSNTLALVGPLAEDALKKIRVDTCFIATNALDVTEGLTTPNMTEAMTKRQMMSVAKRVVLLADHTKLGKVAFAKFAELSEIDQFIVDDKIHKDVLNSLKSMGVQVEIASAESEKE